MIAPAAREEEEWQKVGVEEERGGGGNYLLALYLTNTGRYLLYCEFYVAVDLESADQRCLLEITFI